MALIKPKLDPVLQYSLVLSNEESAALTQLTCLEHIKVFFARVLAVLLWLLWLPFYPILMLIAMILGFCTRCKLRWAIARADATSKAGGLVTVEWGSIGSQLYLPASNADVAESWLLMPILWLVMPFILMDCRLGTTTPHYYARMAERARRRHEQFGPCWKLLTSWYLWTWHLTFQLLLRRGRLHAYNWGSEAQGGRSHWWHGQGVLTGKHAIVEEMARLPQCRSAARAGFLAAVPHAFPPGLMIFLTNDRQPDSEWAEIRRAFHKVWLDESGPDYRARIAKLGSLVQESWKLPSLDKMASANISVLVAKCIFYIFFGTWLDEEEAITLARWRDYAPNFVSPRIVHRAAFNYTLNPIMTLRADSLSIVRKYKLEHTFSRVNAMLSASNQRSSDVQLFDELMFGICFAGIGGTTAAAISVAHFLTAREGPDAAGKIDFGGRTNAGMTALFRQNPKRFIQETCRLSAPVGTFTTLLEQTQELGVLGDGPCPPQTPVSGVIAMCNLDPSVFPDPLRFNPSRSNLEDALSWNGKAFGLDERRYPRICPGRYLAVEIISIMAQVALGNVRR